MLQWIMTFCPLSHLPRNGDEILLKRTIDWLFLVFLAFSPLLDLASGIQAYLLNGGTGLLGTHQIVIQPSISISLSVRMAVLVIMALLIALYGFITSKTVAGRQIYALGGNRKAANLSGIDTKKVFFWVYTNMGILSAVAGIVLSARNSSSTPKAGDGFEMDAIASCYIGGAAVAGGAGTIMGAVVGAFIMGILNNGMSLYGWSTDIQKIVKGAVLLGAVTVDVMSKRKKG